MELATEKILVDSVTRHTAKESALQQVIDLGSVFGAILALELLRSGHFAFSSLNPNPLWIPVLLGAVRYGTAAGIVCSCIATALCQLAPAPPPPGSEEFYERFLHSWRDPTLWLIASVVIGQIRDRQLIRLHDLDQANERLGLEREEIAAFCAKLEKQCQALERKTAVSQANALVPALLALKNATQCSLAAAFGRAAEAAVGPCSYAVYSVSAGIVEWFRSDDSAALEASLLPQVLEAVARKRRIVSALDDCNDALSPSVLFAAPIWDKSKRQLLGVILVIAMKIDALDRAEAGLTLLAEELADAIDRGVGAPAPLHSGR